MADPRMEKFKMKAGVANTPQKRPDLEGILDANSGAIASRSTLATVARYALHLEAEVRRLSERERCQHCGKEGLPSPTVVLDLRAEVDRLEAENIRLQEQLDAYEKPLTDAESDETAWNIRLEAFAVAYMNLAECRCKHSCNHRDAYNDRRERIDFAINRLREDAELFRTVVEPRLKIFVYGLQPETRLQLEETWNFGTYATPRAFLRSLREQSTTRTTEGDK